MGNVMSVHILSGGPTVVVYVEKDANGNFTVSALVNGQQVFAPVSGFVTPQAALNFFLANYKISGLVRGIFVSPGFDELEISAADGFRVALGNPELARFEKFLSEMRDDHGVSVNNEAEYQKAYEIFSNDGSAYEAAGAIRKLRLAPRS